MKELEVPLRAHRNLRSRQYLFLQLLHQSLQNHRHLHLCQCRSLFVIPKLAQPRQSLQSHQHLHFHRSFFPFPFLFPFPKPTQPHQNLQSHRPHYQKYVSFHLSSMNLLDHHFLLLQFDPYRSFQIRPRPCPCPRFRSFLLRVNLHRNPQIPDHWPLRLLYHFHHYYHYHFLKLKLILVLFLALFDQTVQILHFQEAHYAPHSFKRDLRSLRIHPRFGNHLVYLHFE